MASFYLATVEEFLKNSEGEVLAQLQSNYARRGYTTQYSDQILAWEHDLRALRQTLDECVVAQPKAKAWGLLLEFSIPRKELRIDAVLLVGQTIVLIESKNRDVGAAARQQVEQYALLLHYFHKGTAEQHLLPVLVSPHGQSANLTRLRQSEFFPQLSTYWIAPVQTVSWDNLSVLLLDISAASVDQLDLHEWNASVYFPVPSIIDAALALSSGLEIREIAHSEASEHEIGEVQHEIQSIVRDTKRDSAYAICFLTGVPGSGKTLVGLSLAHADENRAESIHFMSGNGPLVKVLQHLFTQESMRRGTPAPQAKTESTTLLENVHVFARYYTTENLGPPSNHAIIFDEAQRAWNRAQNLRKFKRDYSEPEMLLQIMERQPDWAVVVALVGGGQEINDGEAGLEEWGRALSASKKPWKIYASPEVLTGGPSTAGRRLFDSETPARPIKLSDALHLRTSNRSLRAEQLATWVNFVLSGDAKQASALKITDRFPIFLTRSIDLARTVLRRNHQGESRFGLIGSSGAARLRAVGLEPSSSFHAEYPWEHWYLANESDVRSSYRCEVFATEFEIQGLELDWVALCWGGDMIWDPERGWLLRALRHGVQTKWSAIKNEERRYYRRNAYRVLLTRARQGMVLFVPEGNVHDQTNLPIEWDATAEFLLRCGVIPLFE
jgi:hypothetical protein